MSMKNAIQFTIITVGKCRTDYIREGFGDYLDRLRRYCKVRHLTVKAEPVRKNARASEILAEEAKRIRKILPEKSYLFALDRSGESIDSLSLAHDVERRMLGDASFTWIVGSALGLHESILKMSNRILSLSKLTFPHELTLLILTEQLYRLQTILNGEQYHK
jgi:23S rRNA (pseudouridine1915-N3)-methyltransferase